MLPQWVNELSRIPSRTTLFLEGFAEWMDSPEGELSMEVSDAVWELLDTASVHAGKRHIIWEDGEALDIDQSLDRIHKSHCGRLRRQSTASDLAGSPGSLKQQLSQLVDRGYLTRHGGGRTTWYTLR